MLSTDSGEANRLKILILAITLSRDYISALTRRKQLLHFSRATSPRFCAVRTEGYCTMRLDQACAEFLTGYFSTHDRRQKTETAYRLDLSQFRKFAGVDSDLLSLSGTLIEQWAAHLRQEKYSPASIRRKTVTL